MRSEIFNLDRSKPEHHELRVFVLVCAFNTTGSKEENHQAKNSFFITCLSVFKFRQDSSAVVKWYFQCEANSIQITINSCF